MPLKKSFHLFPLNSNLILNPYRARVSEALKTMCNIRVSSFLAQFDIIDVLEKTKAKE